MLRVERIHYPCTKSSSSPATPPMSPTPPCNSYYSCDSVHVAPGASRGYRYRIIGVFHSGISKRSPRIACRQNSVASRSCWRFYDSCKCLLPPWDRVRVCIFAERRRSWQFPTLVSNVVPRGANLVDHEEKWTENANRVDGISERGDDFERASLPFPPWIVRSSATAGISKLVNRSFLLFQHSRDHLIIKRKACPFEWDGQQANCWRESEAPQVFFARSPRLDRLRKELSE